MPDPVVPASQGAWNPPGADINLDELFAETQPTTASQSTTSAPPTTTTEPQTYAYTYKTREETERGIKEKDTFIANLRSDNEKLKAQIGHPAPPTQATQPRFIDKVKEAVAAAEAGRPEQYEQVMEQFVLERLGPAAAILMENAKDSAIRKLEPSAPGIRTFIGSDAYKAYLDERPILKDAVANAESNVTYAPQLSQIYQIAYEASLGRRLPTQTEKPAVESPTSRPTLSPSVQVPPVPAPAHDPQTKEGRDAIIKDMEQRGIGKAKIISF